MIGGLTGCPLENATGPGTPMPIPRTSARRVAELCEQGREVLVDDAEDALGARGDVHVERLFGQGRTGEIAHREPRVRRAQVGDEDDAGALVEGQQRRRAAAGRRAPAGLVDELVGEQRVHALRDRRPREPGDAGEIGAGHPLRVADQAEDGAGPDQRCVFLNGHGAEG